jgi:hypothetical protein
MSRKKERRPNSLPLSPVKKDGSEEGRHDDVQCNVHCRFAVKKLPLQLLLMLIHACMHSLTHSLTHSSLQCFFASPMTRFLENSFLFPKRLLNKILLLLLLQEEEEEEVGSLCFQETPNLRGVFPFLLGFSQDCKTQESNLGFWIDPHRDTERDGCY